MEVRLLDYTRDPLMVLTAVKAKIEGKHKIVDEITDTEALDDFNDSLNSGIYGIFEFIDFTFDVIGVSRSFTHQAVRTRHASYMQESLRFSAHRGKLFQYHTGPSIDTPEKKELYSGIMQKIQEGYEKLLDVGVATEDARGVLPSDILTSIVIKIDYRNLLHMAEQRLCFPAGTKVISYSPGPWNPDGGVDSYIFRSSNIEDICVGDYVLSYNEKTGVKERKKVLKTFVNSSSDFVSLKFSNGNSLIATPEHPIAVVSGGDVVWTRACDILQGDRCLQYKYTGLNIRCMKGKKIEDRVGVERGAILRESQSDVMRNNNPMWDKSVVEKMTESIKNNDKLMDFARNTLCKIGNSVTSSARTGKTYEELYGPDRALDIKRKIGNRAYAVGADHHMFGKKLSVEAKMKISENSKKMWADEEFRRKNISRLAYAGRIGPNFIEYALANLLDNNFPGEWQYSGDGSVSIDGLSPDFVNINGRKKVIELLGCYWHCCPTCGFGSEEDQNSFGENLLSRAVRFATNGYDMLPIWEHDMADFELVISKVRNYMFNPGCETVVVESAISFVDKSTPVYNIEVEDNSNYFAFGILSHNCQQSQLEHREFMMQVKSLISTKVHPLLGEQLKPSCMRQGFCTWGSRLDRPCELQKRYPIKRIA